MENNITKDDIKRSKERIIATGEVYTDEHIVRDMLDMVKSEDWENPTITMLEPSCGDGNFVVIMIEKFMDGLKNVIPDERERFKNIIENQVFAIDIMADNVIATRNRISEKFGYNINDYNHNIIQADTLAYDCLFGKTIEDELGMIHQSEKKLTVSNEDAPKEKNSAPRKSVSEDKIKKPDIDSFFD